MPSRPSVPRRVLAGAATIVLAFALARAGASERSEVLVAHGELAFHRGNLAEARRNAEAAVAADDADASAQLLLGRVLLALDEAEPAARAFEQALAVQPDLDAARQGLAVARKVPGATGMPATRTVGEIDRLAGVRSGGEARRWGLSFTTGVQYDSNVTLTPSGRLKRGDHGDVAFVLAGGGHYDLVDRPDMLLRLEYDLYQTLHPDLTDFDFRSHQVKATGSYALAPALWVGVQGEYDHYTLGPRSYSSAPSVMPFVSLLEGEWGLTQLTYRHGEDTYLSSPFHDRRDGPVETVALTQSFYFAGGRYATIGYEFVNEDPRHVSSRAYQLQSRAGGVVGSDYQTQAHEGFVGGGTPLGAGVFLDALYLFRYDDYTRPNSAAQYRKTRQDAGNFFYAGLSRPIAEHVSVALAYYGTVNVSNLPEFDYRRHVVAALLQVTY